MIVQVQALLFASLTASLFSAFLVILGKQWLNRYASIDMRGSAIERSRNRQRKLDGIVNWYFDNVMESLPLMLQAALLLLGCALSRHLWEINMTVALVVLGVTSFDVLFYLFIVIAGAVFASCPYQTPGAHILRHILDALRLIFRHIPYFPHRIRDTFHRIRYVPRHIPYVLRRIQDKFHHILHDLSVLYSVLVGNSITYPTLVKVWGRLKEAQCSSEIALLLLFILLLPIWLILDVCRAIVWSLVISFRWVDHRVQKESERRAAVLDQQTAVLDQHCISWTLRTLLDGPVRLSALDYLATTISADFDPTLVAGCFDVLFGCIKLAHYEVVVTQGSEQLAAASALCCLHILPHLMAKDPTPRVLEDIHQRYTKAFPLRAELDLPAPHTLDILRQTFYSWISWNNRRQIRWGGYKPSSNEHIVVAYALAKISRVEYQRERREKVPCWLLRFALHSLSQSPLPPTSVVIDCLSIVAIDLGCDFSTTTTLGERYV